GLTFSAGSPETDTVLRDAAGSSSPVVRSEALRALRGHLPPEEFQKLLTGAAGNDAAARELREQLLLQTRRSTALQSFAAEPSLAAVAATHPAATQPWPAVLEGEGDPAAGRRIFYHPNGPGCSTCHTIEGRGGSVGPDLTKIAQLTPTELLTAIREPSKDIAPAFTNWLLTLKDGRTVNGIDTFEDDKTGVHLVDAAGKRTRYNVSDIVSREPLPVSLMPPGLDLMVTEQEMRDLLAFLRTSRE
ncbi:MAG TPA: c-type cytochrome, partial [Chthoniobacteraceae bacterium]